MLSLLSNSSSLCYDHLAQLNLQNIVLISNGNGSGQLPKLRNRVFKIHTVKIESHQIIGMTVEKYIWLIERPVNFKNLKKMLEKIKALK